CLNLFSRPADWRAIERARPKLATHITSAGRAASPLHSTSHLSGTSYATLGASHPPELTYFSEALLRPLSKLLATKNCLPRNGIDFMSSVLAGRLFLMCECAGQ